MAKLTDALNTGVHDLIMRRRFDPLREVVTRGLRGRVLEIGAGTGLNFQFYGGDTEVVALEPGRALREKAMERGRAPGVKARVEVVYGRAEQLPFDAESFDAVVATFVLCSLEDVPRSLAEVRRVLRPGGSLWLAEHVRSPDPGVARWQRGVQPVWGRALGGCSLVRDTRDELLRSGFDASEVSPIELPLPWLARAGILGHARRP